MRINDNLLFEILEQLKSINEKLEYMNMKDR